MSEHKYTSDGKKVVVVGKLNNAEFIVQEIFVNKDGSEIPGGENFVVKTLLNEPVKSWDERRAEQIKRRLAELAADLDSDRRKVSKARQDATATARALREFAKHAAPEQMDDLVDFVAGEITHLVTGFKYGACVIEPFTPAVEASGEYHREHIRLLSLYGQTGGDMSWKLHHYSDMSGSTRDVIPAKSYEHAVQIVQDLYDVAVNEWSTGKSKTPPGRRWVENVPELVEPLTVIRWRADNDEANRLAKIAKLQAEIAKLEGESK